MGLKIIEGLERVHCEVESSEKRRQHLSKDMRKAGGVIQVRLWGRRAPGSGNGQCKGTGAMVCPAHWRHCKEASGLARMSYGACRGKSRPAACLGDPDQVGL